MQRLPAEPVEARPRRGREAAGLAAEALGVERIAHHGMAHMRRVDADLVRAAGFEVAGDAARLAAVGLLQAPVGHGAAPPLLRHYGHAQAVRRVATHRGVDRPEEAIGRAPDEGDVRP